jgi:hypothetical protein
MQKSSRSIQSKTISEEKFWELLTSGKIGTNVGTVKIITEEDKN